MTSDDERIDEGLEGSFPASDAPGNTVETGIGGVFADGRRDRVTDNRARSRFEIAINGEIAFLQYERKPDALVLVHTEVPAALRGHRVGDELVEAGLEAARSAGLRVVPLCPFVRAYLRKHHMALAPST